MTLPPRPNFPNMRCVVRPIDWFCPICGIQFKNSKEAQEHLDRLVENHTANMKILHGIYFDCYGWKVTVDHGVVVRRQPPESWGLG